MNHTRDLSRHLTDMYSRMVGHFGPQNWWPAQSELEVVVGAVLTQNTNWRNVEKAIVRLKEEGLLSVKGLHEAPEEKLARVIRAAGYYNVKARRLKNLMDLIVKCYNGKLSQMLEENTQRMREMLLSVNGVGPETADSILLYAARRPIFVVDAYTRRILSRHRFIDSRSDYNDLQRTFQDHLPADEALFNEFHALIVQTGKTFCRKRPACARCPLLAWPRGHCTPFLAGKG